MAEIETESIIDGILKVSWIKLLLLPLGFVLANLERMSAQTFFSLGTCQTLYTSIFPINSFTLVKYLCSSGSLAWYAIVTCDVTI